MDPPPRQGRAQADRAMVKSSCAVQALRARSGWSCRMRRAWMIAGLAVLAFAPQATSAPAAVSRLAGTDAERAFQANRDPGSWPALYRDYAEYYGAVRKHPKA